MFICGTRANDMLQSESCRRPEVIYSTMQPVATTSVAVGLFGVGLIGKALMSQINAQVGDVRLGATRHAVTWLCCCPSSC